MKLLVTNTFTHIKFTTEQAKERRNIIKTLNIKLNPFRPFHFRSMAFKMHVWDGRIHLIDLKKLTFPSGMLHDVYRTLLSEQRYYQDLQVTIEDERAQPIRPQVPDTMEIGGHKLRDYQIKGIEKAIKYQRVTINSATNSGKTSIAAGIIKVCKTAIDNTENILMFTQSKDVTQQDRQSLEHDLHVPVGMLGGGEHTVHQITCATARTLASALKDPAKKVKLTSKKDKTLQYMAEKYVPKFLPVNNKSLILKSYINTHTPKYSYDENCFEQLSLLVGKSDSTITKALQYYQKMFDKLLYSKNKGAFNKYKRMVDFLSNVKVVFVDEAQHAPAKSFQKALAHMPNARMRIALTGTVPTDKVKHAIFVSEFGHHIMKVSNDTLIKRGISAIPEVTKVPVDYCIDYKGNEFNLTNEAFKLMPLDLPKNAQDIRNAQIQNDLGVVHNKYRNDVIAKLACVLYKVKGGVTLIVVNYLAHGKLINRAIHNINPNLHVVFLQGKDTNEDRREILKETKKGKINVLIATRVINEGLNIPSLQSMIYASAGKSSVELLQRVGRLLRKFPDQKYVYIWDIYDETSRILYNQSVQRFKIYKQQKFDITND